MPLAGRRRERAYPLLLPSSFRRVLLLRLSPPRRPRSWHGKRAQGCSDAGQEGCLMGKRSNFARIDRDAYQTIDPRAVDKLIPHLRGIRTFAEPCAGEGYLVGQLQAAG